MRFAAALMLTSFAAMAQQPPPAEVDQALRARVNEFFHYHVTGEFMKAFGYVAEETKEYYFAVQKRQYISYTVGNITYSDNFTKATVDVVGKAKMRPRPEFPEIVIDQPMSTTWKIENGKWVWYVSMTVDCPTPMSCGPDGKPRVATPAPQADPSARKCRTSVRRLCMTKRSKFARPRKWTSRLWRCRAHRRPPNMWSSTMVSPAMCAYRSFPTRRWKDSPPASRRGI